MTGRLAADVNVIKGEKGNFISFALYEHNRDKDKPNVVECTRNFKDEEPGVTKFLTKGTLVMVTGRPHARAYIDKDGKAIAQLGCYVDMIELLNSAKQE